MARSRSPQQQRIRMALGSTSTPPGMVISRMDRLRRADERERADLLAREAATADPATAVGMLAILHAAGRDGDAEALLRLIASADAATCGAIVHALCVSADAADAQVLVDLIQSRSAVDLAAAAVAFERSAAAYHGPGPERFDNPLVGKLAARPTELLIAEFVLLRGDHRDEEAAVVMAVIARGSPLTVCAAAAELAERRAVADAGTLLLSYAQLAAPVDLARMLLRLAESWENAALRVAPIAAGRADVAAFLAALRTLAPQGAPNDYPGALASRLTWRQITDLCHVSTRESALDAVDDLLRWCARDDDARTLQTMLHDDGLHAAAYRLAERLAEITGRYEP